MASAHTSDRHPVDHRGRTIPEGSWPDGRAAPDGLEFVRRFCNTANLESGADRLETAALADDWLRAEGRSPIDATDVELATLKAVREQIRDLLAVRTNQGAPCPPPVSLSGLTVRLAEDGRGGVTLRAPADASVEAILVELAMALVAASSTDTIERLKTCGNTHCRWVYYDWSRNSGRRWCSMRACGGRHKARAYRRRRTEDAGRKTPDGTVSPIVMFATQFEISSVGLQSKY